MKRTITAVAVCLVVWAATAHVQARTVTEGTLDIQNIANGIDSDLKDYTKKKDLLVDNIKSVQKGIGKLRQDYGQAETDGDRIMIKARTLREVSRLLDFYSRFYKLNIQKVGAILPRLQKLKAAARKGALGQAARRLKDPQFKKNMNDLYSNLATFAVKFGDARQKKEVASLLRDNELLYRQGTKGLNVFDDIMKNIEKITGYLKSVYVRTALRAKILQRKKFQTAMAVELMQYALALRPIQKTMLQINPEGVMDVPDINISEFVDPIINESGENGEEPMSVSDPDTDQALKSYQNGVTFFK